MRYQNWDVLVFPDQSKVPLQEFKTACQVIQDTESHDSQTSPLLLPTVTSFIPGLSTNAHFRISIHSWQNPETSRYLQSLKKPNDMTIFEARVLIDGRVAGSKWFNQNGPWPTILELSVDLDKHGDFEKLRFPAFHKELLSQSYWNAGDDLGRVKVVIAEGFSRDNMSYPFERVKNLVSFSFQHAPLDVLETSSIAWPNAAMWRQVSLVGPYFTQHFSPQPASDAGVEAHTHSPRRSNISTRPVTCNMGALFSQNQAVFPRQPTFDPFTEPLHSNYNSWRQLSSTDVSMPDYSSRTSTSRHVSDPMVLEKQDRRFESMQIPGAYESICEALLPSVPVNTPQNGENTPLALAVVEPNKPSNQRCATADKTNLEEVDVIPALDLDASDVSNSIRSQNEKIQVSIHELERSFANIEEASRQAPHVLGILTNISNKRQRVITPAASKVIDDEDEPRSSPSLRKLSGRSIKQEPSREGERRVPSGFENM